LGPATVTPALLFVDRDPFRIDAEDRAWLQHLTRPAILVTLPVRPPRRDRPPHSDQAAIVYGAMPIEALKP